MRILNSCFRSKRVHRKTWRHKATGRWKRIDYICSNRWIERMVADCRVHIGASRLFDTDHRMVMMNIRFPVCAKRKEVFSKQRKKKSQKAKTDYSALVYDPEVRSKLTEQLDMAFDQMIPDDVNKLNEIVVTKVRECADEVCPKLEAVKRKEPWDDEELKKLIDDQRKYYEVVRKLNHGAIRSMVEL
ncbi:uncharacterized protein LOC117116864 [Anneissia japonica]|uniref:uncharacterized protein LOC117116864 n=1 Tax=Anneissia japonica TaxID=1529436 RepID=UPI00142573E6|nr:uncharacterized protein LOC117116864 [Anneissia japonica]